jgi:hypothetical protein
LDAAQSQATDPAILAELATSEHVFVREAVAANSKTSPQTLSALAPDSLSSGNYWNADCAFRVAFALLSNPNTPEEVLRRLGALAGVVPAERYTSRDFYALMFLDALAGHPEVTAEILGCLLDPGVTRKHVRDRISRRATNRSVLQALASDPSASIRSRVARALTGER